jgi:hypothetical protein
VTPSLLSASTSPERRCSQDSHDLPSVKPNKYKLIFEQQERLGSWGYTPQDRIKAQGQHLKELQESLSANLKHSHFFTFGTQKNDRHFRDLYAQFFAQIHGNDALVDGASKDLVRKSGRYVDLHFGGLEDRLNYPSKELLEELLSLAHEKQGLQQALLDLLKKNYRKLKPNLKLHDWETTHANGRNVDANYFLTYLLQKGMLGLKPSFHQNLRDICIKILEIAWLENDIDQLKLFILDPMSPMKTPSPSKNSSPLNIKKLSSYQSETPQGFEFSGKYYEIKTTVGDGACALHALLGQEVFGEFEFFGPGEDIQQEVKPLFLEKIRDFEDNSFLLKILKGHLHAQNDPSSNLLFSNQQGTLLKHEYHEIKANFQPILEELSLREAQLWTDQLILSQFKEKILQEAIESIQNTGKLDPQIIDEIRSEPVLILNAINANRDAFSQGLSAKKKQQLAQIKADYQKALDDREKAEKDYLLQKVYPHYEAIFQTPEFFLNTEELELAAKVFEKKTQVVKHSDSGEIEAATAVLNSELDSDLILIYHQGVHFSRCEPCSESRLNSYLIRNTYEKALQGADQAKKASEKFWSSLKEESSKMIVSAMYAAGTKNPIPLGVQVAKSGVNTFGHYLDPKNESIVMQMAQLIANSGVAKYVGGNPKHIAQGLVVDAVNVYAAPKPSTKEESNLRGIGLACVKGVLTLDPEKFCENFLGQVIADGSREFVPEEKESDGMGMRLLRSAVTSPDMHGVLVDSIIKDPPKTKPKEDSGQRVEVDPDRESKFPKQVITEGESEQIIAEINAEQTSVEPEMHDHKEYQRLVFEEGLMTAALEAEQSKLVDPNYSKFGTPQDTRIQTKAGVVEAEKNLQIKKDKNGDTWGPKQAREAEKKLSKAYDNKNDAIRKDLAVENYIDQTTSNVAELTQRLESNRLAQAVASSPKHIPAPTSGVHIIGNEKTGKNHHPYYFENGEKQGLGKYDNAEDAGYISGLFTSVETNKLSLDRQCFDGQNQLVQAGFSIDDIPKRPTLSMPTILGNDVGENQRTLNTAAVNHKKEVQQYLSRLESLLGKSITAQGLSKSEISQITKQVSPSIKDPKEHGFWYKAWRAPGKGLRWLDDHGVALSLNVNVSRPLYKTKAPQSSYRDTQHQIAIESTQLPSIEQPSQQRPIMRTWENIQAGKAQQIFEMNMNYQSPIDLGRNNLSQNAFIPNRQMQIAGVPGKGVAVTAQLIRGLFSLFLPDMSDMPGAENPMDHINRIVTDEATGDFIKSLPKGGALALRGVVSLMLPDMSGTGAEDPKEHFKRVFDHNLKKYDQLVQIQNPNGLAAKSGVFVGDMLALGGIGKVIRTAQGISVFGMGCEGGFISGVMSEAHDTNVVAGVAFGFAGGAGVGRLLLRGGSASRPLIDRSLTMTKQYSNELRFLKAVNNPTYRSGLSFPKMGLMPGQPKLLTERTVLKLEGLEIKASKGINSSNNHQFVVWVEGQQTRTASIGEMSHAGTFKDKGKEGISKAGRGLQKHAARENPSMPKPSGNISEVNSQGQKILDEILNHPNKIIIVSNNATKRVGTNVIDVFIPEKYGARFTQDGKTFIGFLEPNRVPK